MLVPIGWIISYGASVIDVGRPIGLGAPVAQLSSHI